MGCHRPFSFSPLCLTYRRKNRKLRSDFASAAVATPPISKEIKEIVPAKILVDIGKIEHRVVFFSGTCGPEVSHLGWRRWYTLRELEAATNGLCEEKVIGEGCYGIVYRGILTDGTKVAVKNLLNNREEKQCCDLIPDSLLQDARV